ncbi:uncharacterized protein LOC110459902 [Mizuhopecten yessoensis]|uniref:Ankyrin-1 n=1 Tax=Mizuhopecten yessoensis TaxID=6573 RepID=A0A210Q3G0_MIZYE|nr:uncharacterized protein LOC110459902 [Mizuhopecten yessoensis]XP_021368060.1 uncharacterized protein LOC110459902 [Mizuhopecten yessoensis]OWF43209.1 Ankyrin-1 [Mizuhopecten yessoensis]
MERKKIRQNANFCRLIMYMCSTGTDVMELALLDVVFNCLLADERKRLEQAHLEHSLNLSVTFEELFPTDGHLPKLNEFEDLTIKKVFRMSHEQGTALDFLRKHGLIMVLQSHRKHLCKHRYKIGEESWNKIDTYKGEVDIKKLDVSLLFFIIRNISKPPKSNWNHKPKEEEISMQDDVCRIHLYRNILAHYRATQPISDSAFDTMWSDLTCAFKRLCRDPDAMERDSKKLKLAPIDDQQQQKYEELVDKWVVEELENVEMLIRHISRSQEDSAEQIVNDVSTVIDTAVTHIKNHTTSAVKSTEREITECVQSYIEETLTQMKEHASMITDDAAVAFNMQLERTSKATKEELGTLIGDSLARVSSDIETRISAVVKDEVAGMSSTLTDPVKQEVGTILTSCFDKAVQDIEKRVAGIVNDTTLRTIEALLAERADQFTAYIIAKVKEELIRASGSDILKEIVRKATDVITEKMAEDNRKHFDTLHRQYASRHPDTSLDPKKRVLPTDSMTVQVHAWYVDEQDFFETGASKTVVECLESKKHLAVIGPPLSGKTTIVRHTALHMRSKGYTVFPISDPSEIDKFLSEEGGQIFIIDDPLGKNSVDKRSLEEWGKVNERLRRFIENVDVKVIWIMNSQQVREDVFRTSGLIFTENNMDITELGLSCEERRGIGAKYLERTFVDDEGAYVNILDVAANCNYFFFPKICSEFRQISKWQQTPENPFLFPFEVLINYFEPIPHRSKHQFNAMGLCAILGRLPSDRKSLRHAIKEGTRHMTSNLDSCDIDLESALQSMKGIWIRQTEEHFEFSDEIYRDVILFLMRKQVLDPSTVLMNLSCRSIRERVRYDPGTPDEVPEKYVFVLEKRYWKELSFHICHDLLHLRKGLNLREGHNEDTFKEKYKTDVLQLLENASAGNELCSSDFLAITALSIQTENAEMIDTLFQNQPSEAVNTLFNETVENSKMGVVGFSPLHFAVSKSSLWGVDRLLERGGANINTLSGKGLTPLDLAVKNENLPLVSELIKFGADLNIPSNRELCPVHFAIQRNYVKIVGTLVDGGADMTICTPEGLPPLHLAIYGDNTEVVKELLELDVDTNIRNGDDKPALNFALEQDEPNVSIIEMLVAHPKTDVNCLNCSRGYDHPLHTAVILENVRVVTVLLECERFDVNCLDSMNSTPLHIAVRNNNKEITFLLLTYNANTTLKDINGKTPWQIANEHGNKNLADSIKILIQ